MKNVNQMNVNSMTNSTKQHTSNKKWYVIRVYSGKESKVKESIDAALKTSDHLVGYVSQVLVPTEEVKTIRNGKAKTKKKPLYSGYVFVEAELTRSIMAMLRDMPNVLGVLSDSKNNPIPLSHKEVIVLLGTVDKRKEIVEEVIVPYEIGDSVKVTDGPFKDFNALIEDIDKNKNKLHISVKIFGRRTSLQLELNQVKKA